MTVGAIGVILILSEKVGAITSASRDQLAKIADEIARESIRQDGLLLAQLLSTDVLDSRPADSNFRPGTSRNSRKFATKRIAATKNFSEITEYYLTQTRKRLVILGAAGSGKTVLAATLTVGLLKQRKAAVGSSDYVVPVTCMLYLPSWNPGTVDLTAWLSVQIADRFGLSRKIASRLVDGGWIMPVLDGLDEMDSQDQAPGRSESAVSRINDYIARTPDCNIVIVCRSGERYYDRLVRKVRDADDITVENLKPQQMVAYVETHCSDKGGMDSWLPVFDALKGRDSGAVRSALDTPWRLTAAVTFALLGGNPTELLPFPSEKSRPNWHALYSDRVSKLLMGTLLTAKISLYKHRSSANSITARLRTVAKLTTTSTEDAAAGNEIVLHQWWKVFEERKVLRTHALFVWTFMHIPFAVLAFVPLHGPNKPDLFLLLAVASNYITISLVSFHLAMSRKGPIALRIAGLRTRRGIVATAIGLVFSAAVGVAGALASGSLYGAGMAAASAASFTLIPASIGLDPADATRPMATLINDRNFAIIASVAIGAYATLYYVTIYGITIAFVFAGMGILGVISASSYMRYLAAAYWGASHERLPFRFAHFLDWCHSAGILRISGAGYQFRHQELTEYLIASPTDEESEHRILAP